MVESHTLDNIRTGSLKLNKLIGNSIRKGEHLDLQGSTLAYVTGGGVVVCRVSELPTEVLRQRFLVANSCHTGRGSPTDQANAYLNMIYETKDLESPIARDSYGFNIYHSPIEVRGSCSGGDEEQEQSKLSPSKLKDKARSINCIAISPNGKLLAVGETGYQPRILLYSLAPDLLDQPMALIFDHSFGVSKLKFSEGSDYLCSLGVMNDGIINIWKVNTNSILLAATNRLSAVTNQILWYKNNIVTLGLRTVKIWTFYPEENIGIPNAAHKPHILRGKNVILGQLLNQNFISGDILEENVVAIITGSKKLLLLNVEDMRITASQILDAEALSLSVDDHRRKIWLSTSSGLASLNVDPYMLKDMKQLPGEAIIKEELTIEHTSDYHFDCQLFDLDLNNLIRLSKDGSIGIINKDTKKYITAIHSLIRDAVGVKLLQDRCFIYNRAGVVNQIDLDTGDWKSVIKFSLPSTDFLENSMTAIDYGTGDLAIGDKFGYLYVIELDQEGGYDMKYQIKAHESIVSGILGFEWKGKRYLVSISRDRMIQVFVKEAEWDLIQTLATHTGTLLKAEFNDGRIFVSSSDRTLSIHKIGDELKQEKVISFKNTPVNMKFYQEELVVCTSDKQILIYSLKTYELLRTLKLYNQKINESLLIENFVVNNGVIFTLSQDKSLRSFDYYSGRTLTVNYGFLEPILELFIKNDQLVTITMDGCVFKWDLNFEREDSMPKSIPGSPKIEEFTSLAHKRATRKIIPSSPKRTDAYKRDDLSLSPRSNIFGNTNLSPSPSPRPSRKASISSLNSPPALLTPANSPVVRLTTATLKRIEARKAAGEGSSLRSRSVSPVRRETQLSSNNKTLASKISLPELRTSLGKPMLLQLDKDPISVINASIGQIKSSIMQHELSKEKKNIIKLELVNTIKLLDLDEDFGSLEIEKETLEKYSEKLIDIISSKLNAK